MAYTQHSSFQLTNRHLWLLQVTNIESETAIKKLIYAAGKYDRTRTGALPLDAFEVESMQPEEFKSNLVLAFNLQFTIPELTAIIQLLNRDKPEERKIICAKFLAIFMRLGAMERAKKLKNLGTEKHDDSNCTEKINMYSDADFEGRDGLEAISATDLKFTPSDKECAMSKLRKAAKAFVLQSPGAVNLQSFDALYMAPREFQVQLGRVFKIRLSSSEVGSLLAGYEGPLKDCPWILLFSSAVLYRSALHCIVL